MQILYLVTGIINILGNKTFSLCSLLYLDQIHIYLTSQTSKTDELYSSFVYHLYQINRINYIDLSHIISLFSIKTIESN
jgi:hypothetical protein